MSVIKVATIHNPAEFMISLIRQNCNNPDDLSKIMLSVECMLEAFEKEKPLVGIKQLLHQSEDSSVILV